MAKAFDPELLYVECGRCGEPVLWEPGDTTRLLAWYGVNPETLDERCLIISDGCRACDPDAAGYDTEVVRLRPADDAPFEGVKT
ncbi:MAG: hypothetical protein PWQ57_3450 [Desulfovibrionales bacterium]|jgi:hypothetical protein|nr:hypothetical protein [Desulfovibrionales bacterium]